MHIEIFKIASIKKALNENLSKEDLEHVTPIFIGIQKNLITER